MNNFLNKCKDFFRPVAITSHSILKREGSKNLISAAISILLGLFFGFIVMLLVEPSGAFQGLGALISTGFSNAQNFNRVVYKAIPMIFSGLSIAFAFRLNLFNIGITGQVTLGAFCSIIVGLSGANWFICLLVGMLSGAAAGLICGFLKAKFGVNEVLSGIMLNWVIYYFIGLCGRVWLPNSFKDRIETSNLPVMPENGRMPSLGIPNMGDISVGLIIAIIVVAVIFIVLNYTNFGFELKMSGRNKDAAKYSGVSQTKSILLALLISGALAGICGYMLYSDPIAPSKFLWDSGSNTLLNDGFNGISVSLIAQNSPIGCIFSSIVLTVIDSAQNTLSTISGSYNVHYTELIKSVVIYLAALSSFIGILYRRLNEKIDAIPYFSRDEKNINSKGA